jgi:hypothetical protein
MPGAAGDAGVAADCALEPVGEGRSGEFDGLELCALTLWALTGTLTRIAGRRKGRNRRDVLRRRFIKHPKATSAYYSAVRFLDLKLLSGSV